MRDQNSEKKTENMDNSIGKVLSLRKKSQFT